MAWRIREVALEVLLLFVAAYCRADISPEVVVRAKQATALAEIDEKDGVVEGSAFCIDATGLFVTNAHVVRSLEIGGKLTLMLRSGEKDQTKVTARVLALDNAADLAILQTEGALKVTPLTLGSTDGLIETTGVVAFGYPFGTDLALKEGDYPSITVSTGHVTALRKFKGELAAIQLDASVNPGNSGGPVLDAKGEVIGIIRAGIPGSGINDAIPVAALRGLLTRARVVFTPPSQPREHLREIQEYRIQLLTLPAGASGVTVDLTLSADAKDHRTLHAVSKDGRTFIVQSRLLPVHDGPAPIQLLISSKHGQVSGSVADQNIRVGGVVVPLSQVRRIEYGPSPKVTLLDNRLLGGIVTGLSSLNVDMGGVQTNLNLNQFDTIEVVPASLPASVDYHVLAKQDGKIFGELQGKISLLIGDVSDTKLSSAEIANSRPSSPQNDNQYILNPANRHWYGAIPMDHPPTWIEAYEAAQKLRYLGRRGHLVTVTSAAENDFIVRTFGHVMGGKFWLGAYKDTHAPDYDNPAIGWHWVTGEPWQYTSWQPGEPNGNRGAPHSDFLHMLADGRWNDEQNSPQGDAAKGYLVEFDL